MVGRLAVLNTGNGYPKVSVLALAFAPFSISNQSSIGAGFNSDTDTTEIISRIGAVAAIPFGCGLGLPSVKLVSGVNVVLSGISNIEVALDDGVVHSPLSLGVAAVRDGAVRA